MWAAAAVVMRRTCVATQQQHLPPVFGVAAAAAARLTAARAAAVAAGATARADSSSRSSSCSSHSTSGVGVLMTLEAPSTATEQQQLRPLAVEETLGAVAIPPTARNYGPRVEHVQVSAPGLLSEVVASALQLPQAFVRELIRFGAVHYCPVMPPPSPKAAPRMSQQHLARLAALRQEGVARHGRNPQLQVPQRCLSDVPVAEGGYIRVHVHPKRFAAAHAADWRARVLADTPQYVVVDKPPGVQVPPTVDNVLESVVACTARALGLPPGSLLNTHRLDVGTSGVVVLAKTTAFATWFSTLLARKPGAITKTYRCLTAAPPPLGPLLHWAVVRQRGGGEPAHTRILGPAAAAAADGQADDSADSGSSGGGPQHAVRCELVVLQVQRVSLAGDAAAQWGPAAYESELQLVTGRTHQIRAQMAAVGCPLLGDELYSVLGERWAQARRQQHAEGAEPQQQQQEEARAHVLDAAPAAPADGSSRHRGALWSKLYQEDPSRPIGLQAAKLAVRNVQGRMRPSVAATGSAFTGSVEGAAAAAAVATAAAAAAEGDEDAGDWVVFSAGVPWWRAAAVGGRRVE